MQSKKRTGEGEGEVALAQQAGDHAPTPPPANDEPSTAPATETALKRSPAAWAHFKGLLVSDAKKPWVEPHARGGHAEASNLYQWHEHAHHYQGEAAFKLTEADYDKARETALNWGAEGVELHAPAWPWRKDERPMPQSVEQTRKAAREAADKAKAERKKAQVS
jgi:hypothetical protein